VLHWFETKKEGDYILKLLIISIATLVFLRQVAFVTFARSENSQSSSRQNNSANKSRGDNLETEEESTMTTSELAKSKNAVSKLNRIAEVTDDPEIATEVAELKDEQEDIEENTNKLLEKVDDRSAVVKFLIGPDYKNLGQLRKDVVHLRNNIKKLERMQEKASEAEQPAIEAALLELEEKASSLQSEMYKKLSNFSLFGWLFRWMSGFTPEVEVSPTPTITVIPTSITSPTSTPSATLSPTVTNTPTLTPVVTQEVTPTGV